MQVRFLGKSRCWLIMPFLLCLALTVPARAGGDSLEMQVWPDVVEIGAFFEGHAVKVTGKVPRGAQVVMEITGQTAVEHLMRKGRRGGLWMNVGAIDISGAPSLYQAASTSPPLLTAPSENATWGYPALKQQIALAGQVGPGEQEFFLDQFFRLKESEGVYALLPGDIKVSDASGDFQTMTGTFTLPSTVKPGPYRICLTVVQGGQVIANNDRDLHVIMVGFPAMLAALAYEHRVAYGVLAVVIAVVTGFVMGYLFKGGGRH